MNIEIRPVEQYEQSMLKLLLDETFEREYPEGEWEWLSQNPLGENLTYIAEDEEVGELVSSYSLLPMLVRYGSKRVWASLANRASVREGWRRQGLFVRMGEWALAHEVLYDRWLTLGVPNMKALPGHMKVGWQVVDSLWFLEKRYGLREWPFLSVPVDRFGPEFDRFCAENDKRFQFIVCKDATWANWRYVDRPGVEYKRYAYMEDGRMFGYIVLKDFEGDGLKKTHIIDVQAANAEALDDLLTVAESQAAGRDLLNLWSIPLHSQKSVNSGWSQTGPCGASPVLDAGTVGDGGLGRTAPTPSRLAGRYLQQDHNTERSEMQINTGNPYEQALLERGFIYSGEKNVLIAHRNYGELGPWPAGAKWFCFGDADVY